MENVALDTTDFRIMDALVRNGRASFASIGAAVGLSPHAAGDRVRRLLRLGVIRGFTALVDLQRVGRSMDAFVDVQLLPSTKPEEFEAEVSGIRSVQELAFVTGRFDYHLRVACTDVNELDETVRNIRDAGGAHTETRLVLRASTYRHVVS